jgi:hypothetical protein
MGGGYIKQESTLSLLLPQYRLSLVEAKDLNFAFDS